MSKSYLIFHISDVGDIPPTPATPFIDDSATPRATDVLMQFSEIGGFPVCYKQEHGGKLIHNLVPVHKTEYGQISTSSKTNLYLHTELAFHPYKPSFIFLLCLRGDEAAATTIASINEIMEKLDEETIKILELPNFTTGIDESFKNGKNDNFSLITPVLRNTETGFDDSKWTMTFDLQLMKGLDADSEFALNKMRDAVNASVDNVYLKTGDLMLIDNNRAVHGRSSFQPRYDGTDRWVKRLLTIKHMPPRQHIHKKTIVTEFSN